MQIAKFTEEITITSLELVEFVNGQRGTSEAELRHRDFCAKVPKVLGEGVCEKFRAPHTNPQNGQVYYIYKLPKREACLMAMSYSYDLQAKVFDRMTALEEARSIRLPNFSDPAEAARAWALVYEEKQAALALAHEATRTKAEIGSRREATAMATASSATRKANELERQLDKAKDYATVKRMTMLHHGIKYDWRKLRDTGVAMEVPAIDVFDQNYGTVKAYHKSVWQEAYAVDIHE